MENKGIEETHEKEKCFVIMPISDQGDYPKGHFQKVYEQIFVPAIKDAGYEAFRVDEDNMSTPIVEKIFRAIQECPMAVCDLSNRNPNVLYELGIRQAYDKPVVLVQDDKTERIFDVSGINTVPYKSTRLYEDVLDARKKITEAILATKAGEHNTIVKVVNAQVAVKPSGNMTKEDKIEIMLSGLVKDVNDLKRENRLNAKNIGNQIRWSNIDDEPIFCESQKVRKPNVSVGGKFELKKGVTNKRIQQEIERITFMYNEAEIYYKRNSEIIEITVFSFSRNEGLMILDELREKLGN